MNWFKSTKKGIISLYRNDVPEELWIHDPSSGEMVFHSDVKANMNVVPSSGFHLPIKTEERMVFLFDEGQFIPVDLAPYVQKISDFKGKERLKRDQKDDLRDMFAATGSLGGESVLVGGLHVTNDNVFAQKVARFYSIVSEIASIRELPLVVFLSNTGKSQKLEFVGRENFYSTTGVEYREQRDLPIIAVIVKPSTLVLPIQLVNKLDFLIEEPEATGLRSNNVRQKYGKDLDNNSENVPVGELKKNPFSDLVVPRTELRNQIKFLISGLVSRRVGN